MLYFVPADRDVVFCMSRSSCCILYEQIKLIFLQQLTISLHTEGDGKQGGDQGGDEGEEEREPSVEKPPMCGPSPFTLKGTDPIILATGGTEYMASGLE